MTAFVNENRVVRKFIELTAIDSETGHEAVLFKQLRTELALLGLTASPEVLGGNLLAQLPATHSGKTLLLSAHMDTVQPGCGVRAVCRDGRLYSQGETILGADDKAGIAAILEALRVLQERSVNHAAIDVLFTHGEESGLKGIQSIASDYLQADYGYTFDGEGPVGGFIQQSNGQVLLTATFTVAADSSLTAVAVARRVIRGLKGVRVEKKAKFTVSRFAGIDLKQAAVLFSVQSLSVHPTTSMIDSICQVCKRQAAACGGTVCFQTQSIFPGYAFASDHPLVQQAEAAIRQIGRKPVPKESSGGSDANFLCSAGVPTLNLAVGFEQIHTASEYLPVVELIKASELVLALIDQALTRERRREG
ncbi:MAG: M20/M25/M40 family metallo-hydrolase [Sporolactobacillus sp.]